MDLSDIRVLDLFAGTGALGLEALSRGARQVIFVDSCANVLRVAQDNAKLLGVKSQCIFLRADAMKFLQGLSNPFDLILADPPYAYADLNVLVAAADRRLVAGGLLVLEHDARIPPTDAVWNRRYGRTGVAVYRHSK